MAQDAQETVQTTFSGDNVLGADGAHTKDIIPKVVGPVQLAVYENGNLYASSMFIRSITSLTRFQMMT